MKKKYLYLFSIFLLISCNQSQSSDLSYHYSLSNELRELIEYETESYKNDFPFYAEASSVLSSTHENYYVVTVTISYKDTTITDFRSIAIPSSFTIKDASNIVANVGYDDYSFTLAPSSENQNALTFPGFRISYLTNNINDGVKVSLRGLNSTSNEEIKYLFLLNSTLKASKDL